MSYATISQAEARQLRKERDEARQKLEVLLRRGTYSNLGTHLGGEKNLSDITMARIRTARLLGYAVIAVPRDGEQTLDFRALKPGEY